MAGNRNFYMARGATYIENQTNYISGNQIIGRDNAPTAADAKESSPCGIEDKTNAIVSAIGMMEQDGSFRNKYDFSAIKKVIDEMAIFERFTGDSLLAMIGRCELSSSHRPSASSLKALTFGNAKHPDWKIADKTPEETKRLIDLAEHFKSLYFSLLG